MLGLKRRKRQEGWALDVEQVEPDGRDNSLRQRLADNDKLWAALIVLIVLFVVGYNMALRWESNVKARFPAPPVSVEGRSYNDEAHRKFARSFVSRKSSENMVIDARFLNARKFRIVVRGDVSADDISYLATSAANRIAHVFRTRPTVQVYRLSAQDNKETLVATARWRDEKYGFAVKFENFQATAQ